MIQGPWLFSYVGKFEKRTNQECSNTHIDRLLIVKEPNKNAWRVHKHTHIWVQVYDFIFPLKDQIMVLSWALWRALYFRFK